MNLSRAAGRLVLHCAPWVRTEQPHFSLASHNSRRQIKVVVLLISRREEGRFPEFLSAVRTQDIGLQLVHALHLHHHLLATCAEPRGKSYSHMLELSSPSTVGLTCPGPSADARGNLPG